MKDVKKFTHWNLTNNLEYIGIWFCFFLSSLLAALINFYNLLKYVV